MLLLCCLSRSAACILVCFLITYVIYSSSSKNVTMLLTLLTNMRSILKLMIQTISIISTFHLLTIMPHNSLFCNLFCVCFCSYLKLRHVYLHTLHILTHSFYLPIACHQLLSILEHVNLMLSYFLLVTCIYPLVDILAIPLHMHYARYVSTTQGNKLPLSNAQLTLLHEALVLVGQGIFHLFSDHSTTIYLTFTLEALLYLLTFSIEQHYPHYFFMLHLQKIMLDTEMKLFLPSQGASPYLTPLHIIT